MSKPRQTKTQLTKSRLDKKLESGIEASDYERMLYAESLTGGEDVINTEMNEQQALIWAIIDGFNDPMNLDGTRDEIVAYDCPVLRSASLNFKHNMISNKRKGRMEIVKVLTPKEEEEEGIKATIKQAVKGDD